MSQDDKPRDELEYEVQARVTMLIRAGFSDAAELIEKLKDAYDRLAAELAECRSDLQLHRQKLESCYSSDEYAQLKQALAEQMAGALEIALSSVEPQISKPADEALAAWREFGGKK